MSWESDGVEILRVMVDDLEEVVYTDEKLERVLLVAAFQVLREADFTQDYTIDISEGTIEPDPTLAATKEESFTNLMTLKAACIMNRGGAAKAASKAILVKEFGTTADLRGAADAMVKLLEKGWCKTYDEVLTEHKTSGGTAGAMVMGPVRLYANGVGRIYPVRGD
jgi:hypothetical protein